MKINDLDLNLLKAFVLVAEEKHFSLAAKKLFIEQSAVSKSIKRLEQSLGTSLFLRTKRRVELTSKGTALLSIARQVLLSSEDFIKLAEDKENELSGAMKFGAVSPLSFIYLPEVISEISKDYPRLWPQMFTGLVDDLSVRVRRRELEFAFLEFEGTRLKDLEYTQIGHCHYKIVAVPKLLSEAMNSFIGSREVHDQSMAKFPTFDKLRKINKKIQIKYSTNDFMAYKNLILRGLGIGLMPELLIKEEIKKNKLKVLYPELELSFPVHAIHRSGYPLSLEASRTIELLQALL